MVDRSLTGLYPPFMNQILSFNDKIIVKKLNAHVFESMRPIERQQELFSKGRREVNGIWEVVNKAEVVTNAKPGLSFHNYGLAVDYAFDASNSKPGIQWTWELPPDSWKVLGDLGETLGLNWAGNWRTFREFPHFQWRTKYSSSDLLSVYNINGLQGVWDLLNKEWV